MAKLLIEIAIDDKGTPVIRQLGQATAETGKRAEEASQGVAHLGQKVDTATTSVTNLLNPVALLNAAIGAGMVAAIKSAVGEATQFADEIHRLRLLTGSSVRDLAALVDVANDVGVEFGAVQMALLRLATQSEETDGVLAQLNLTAKDGVGRLAQLAQELSGVTDANQRAAIASEVFGARVAAGLLPLMDRLKNGMVDLGAETNDFANILGDDGVTALRDFGIAQGQVGDALLAFKIVVAKDLLPVMGPLIAMTEQMVKWFYAVPAPVRAAVEVLGLAAGAITAVNLALRLFGVTTLAMSGPAGWIALAVAGIAVLVTSLEGLGSKLTSLWTDFKNRGMTPVPAPSAGAAPGTSGGTPAPVILPKEVLEANDAIKQQIETLKAQKIELEQGAVAALKYSLAHGEMAKASPALKAQLVALAQGVQSLKQEQDIATHTTAEAVDELNELKNKERELTQAITDANAATREQNLLFADAGRFADDLREEVDGVISRTRELLQWEQERIDLQVRLKSLSPAEAERERSQALQEAITQLQRYKVEALSAYGSEAQVVKDVDREILKLTADQTDLQTATLTFGNTVEKAFSGILDILSLFGVKVGEFILLLQNLPRAISGLQQVFAGVGGLLTLGVGILGLEETAFAETAKAVTALGNASGETAGVFGFLSNAIVLAINAFSVFSVGLASLLTSAGLPAGLAGGISSLVVGSSLSFGLGSLIPGPGGLGASLGGTLGTGLGMLLPTLGGDILAGLLGANLMSSLLVSLGPMLIGTISNVILPGIGFAVGAVLGPLIGSLFSGPTPGISGYASLQPTDVDTLLNTQLGSVVNPPGASHFSYIQSGPLYSVMNMFRTNGALDRDQAQVAISTILLETLQAATQATVDLIPLLPTEALSQALSDRLDAVLAQGFDITNFDLGEDDLIENFQDFLEGLAGATLQTFSEKIFGPIDLAALGAGDAIKGFDTLTQAMVAMSAIVQSVDGVVETFTPTLEEFAAGAVEFFEQFQREGEALSDTITRVSQDIQSLLTLQNQLQVSIVQLSGNNQQQLDMALAQLALAQDQIIQLADSLTVLTVSGGQPDEILQLAQLLFDAIQSALIQTIDLATALRDEVTRLQQAQTDAVGVLADITNQIIALGGADPTALDQLNAAISATAAGTANNASALISLFASQLQSGIAAFALGGRNPFSAKFRTDLDDEPLPPQQGLVVLPTAHIEPLPGEPQLPLGGDLNDLFLDIFTAIRTSTDPQAAIANLQQLSQVIQQGLADAIQIVQADFAARRLALEEASRLRIEALMVERDLIVENFQARREALETEKERVRASFEAQRDALEQQLATAQAYISVIGSVKQLQTDIFNLLAPTTPTTSLATVREQFRQALAAFQGSPSPEAAMQVQELARQVLDLAKQTPGFDLPSLAFRDLTTEVTGALQVIEQVISAMPSQEELQRQIVALDQMQVDALASIDEQIEQLNVDEQQALAAIDERIAAENETLRQQLADLSQLEQDEIQLMQAITADSLMIIRDELILQMGLLQVQQQQANANLAAMLGGLTYDEFIAQQQAQAVALLTSIDNILRQSLSSLITAVFPPPPAPAVTPVPSLPKGTGADDLSELWQGVEVPGGTIHPSGMFIPSKLIGAEHGLDYVPATQPVLLHRGEMVLPADEAARVRTGAASRGPSITFSPVIHLQVVGSIDERREQEALDKIMSKIIQGPSRTKLALVEAVKRR